MMKLGTQTGSLINHVMSTDRAAEPKIGDGATELMWSDRHACTIVRVVRFKSGTRKGQISAIHVQRDNAICTDGNGMSDAQHYRYERNLEARVDIFRVNQRGKFCRNSSQLLIGERCEYYDYSF